jgi:subtilisin family serine protease
MKINASTLKISMLSSITLVLSGCVSIKNIPVPTPVANGIEIGPKTSDLTENQKNNWSHLDIATDTIPGMSLEKAYAFLEGKKNTTVIVGVIDSGTDLEHEDLKPVAWINSKEIPNNQLDDDKNGYVDDINGWNFLGSIYKENLEYQRIVHDPSITTETEAAEAKEFFDSESQNAKASLGRFSFMLERAIASNEAIKKATSKDTFTLEDVNNIETEDEELIAQIEFAKQMFSYGLSSIDEAVSELTRLVDSSKETLSNADSYVDYRLPLNDDPNDMTNKAYGDNNILHSEEGEAHGTHVSGIIGAVRNNAIGMDGVAANIKLMAVRAVPDGDEYDKDVALAIRYAVDNGAKVLNTSFGKAYSPKREWVYDAIKYAASKDVLIVNAAGNDGINIDVEYTFPNDSPDLNLEIADNFITIGAMGSSYDKNMLASFSNYGKKNVDIFAPGVRIYSTTPNNEYKKFSGTSMAAPSTAGVAALIRSYYPKLTASQVKHIIMNSGVVIPFQLIKPGTQDEMVSLDEICVSGRIVNAYNALLMADKMVSRK